jgi:hypothetical protein
MPRAPPQVIGDLLGESFLIIVYRTKLVVYPFFNSRVVVWIFASYDSTGGSEPMFESVSLSSRSCQPNSWDPSMILHLIDSLAAACPTPWHPPTVAHTRLRTGEERGLFSCEISRVRWTRFSRVNVARRRSAFQLYIVMLPSASFTGGPPMIVKSIASHASGM